MDEVYDAIIIGSGIGGLTCADLLSRRGRKVLVLEQSDRLGGCCATYDLNGHKFDVGAIFILYKEIYERFFEMMGLRLEDYLDLRLLDPVYDMHFRDGSSVLLPMDPVESADVISSFAPGDREGWLAFCRDMQKIWDAAKILVENPFPPLERFGTMPHLAKTAMSMRLLKAIPALLSVMVTNQDAVNRRYMKDRKALTIVSFENLFAGIPADRISGIFAVMSYLSHEGYWYPKGGMGAVPEALSRIAIENGAEIRMKALVTRIVIEGGRAVGVELESGETIRADVVVSNTSAIPTYLDLVGRQNIPARFARAVERFTLSIPAPMVYFGLSKKPEQIKSHFTVMVPPPEQLNAYWDEYYGEGLIPPIEDLPHGLICPSITDPGLAPEGKFSMGFLTASPYHLKYGTWDGVKPAFIEDTISHLDRTLLPGVRGSIEEKDMRTPLDFERELLLPEGSIYGLEMSLPNLGPFRPSWRSPVIRDLYLTGASTNPGGGVPLVMISGINTSACIVRDKSW
ncbi:MAG: phytoene desaturase family protein [Candidatus Geothermincolia bacterium]